MNNYRTIFILILLFIGNQSLNAQEKINQFDADGKRMGIWKKHYNNKRIRYQGQFEKGKEVGIFKFYSAVSSDHPIVIKNFTKNSDIAKAEFYTEKEILQSEGNMKGKNRIGKWLYYHADGKAIMSEENYTNGILEGEAKTFYKTGKVTEILNYTNGNLHGNVKRYDLNGTLLSDLFYENGKLNGLAKYYNVEGKLMYTGNYENDVKVGDWEYYEKGIRQSVNKLKQ